jgi:hypothetical protein
VEDPLQLVEHAPRGAQGQYVYSIPIAGVKAKAHPEAYANWAHRNVIRLHGLRFRPDPDLYDTDGDGQPDAVDPDDDNDGAPDAADPAPRSPKPQRRRRRVETPCHGSKVQ